MSDDPRRDGPPREDPRRTGARADAGRAPSGRQAQRGGQARHRSPDAGGTGGAARTAPPRAASGRGRPSQADDAAYAAEVHAVDRRRARVRHRQTAVFVVIFLLVMGVGVTALGVNQDWWEAPFGQEDASASPPPCPGPSTVPVPPASIHVEVLNSTERAGLAGETADALSARGVQVARVANAGEDVRVPAAARIVYGPEARTAAEGLASVVPGAVLAPDGDRPGGLVSLVLGDAYTSLASPEVVPTATRTPDPADLPAGCLTPSAASTPPAG